MIVRSSLEYTTQRQEISKELVAGHNFAEGLPKKSEIKESAALKVKTTVQNRYDVNNLFLRFLEFGKGIMAVPTEK